MSTIIESSSDSDALQLFGDNEKAFKFKPTNLTNIINEEEDEDEVLRRERYCILVGPAGSGKTWTLCLKVHMLCIKYPGIRVLICRKSLPSLRESIVKTYLDVVKITKYSDFVRVLGETRPTEFHYEENEQEWDGVKYKGVSKISLRQIDMKGTALGAEYDIIYFNQPDAQGLTEEEFLQLSTRARLSNMPYRQIMADPNPSFEGHWLLRGEIEGKWKFFNSTHKDNPKYFDHKTNEWTKDGKEHLAQLEMLPEHLKKSQLEGKWYSLAGMVFQDIWDESKYVFRLEDQIARNYNLSKIEDGEFVNNIPKEWEHYLTIDWGYNPDPFVAVLVAKHPTLNKYIAHKHIYITKNDIIQVAEMVSSMIQGYNVVAIVADRGPAETTIIESYTGKQIIGASKGSGSVESGINLMMAELREEKWLFLDTLQSLQHDKDPELEKKMKPMGYEEIPLLKYDDKTGKLAARQADHFFDAIRYLMRYLAECNPNKKYKFTWLN